MTISPEHATAGLSTPSPNFGLSMSDHLIHLDGISKSFGGVRALDDVSFGIRKGEIHAVVGENGAGKSTLMKILAGVYMPDGGRLVLDGQEVFLASPLEARKYGISIVYQELSLFPDLSIAANLYLGQEIRNSFGIVNGRAMADGARAALAAVGVKLGPDRTVDSLTLGERQLVEIARTLVRKAGVVIMDEPNSALTEAESAMLFDILRKLREQGLAVIYVSHRLEDVFALSDRITVLRDGRYQGTWTTSETKMETIISAMIGQALENELRPLQPEQIEERRALSVRGLRGSRDFGPVSFDVGAGEIVGFAGLDGAGTEELFSLLFGLGRPFAGDMLIDGKPSDFRSPGDSIRAGIGLVPASRRDEGLIMDWSVRRNCSLIVLSGLVNRVGLVDSRATQRMATEWVRQLRIATDSVDKRVDRLSGGNQQKVLLAKWLATGPKILILDDPTRGVDIGAKAEIHRLCVDLASQQMAILFRSSEIEETLAVCDRTIVFRQGRIAGEFPRGQVNKAHLLHTMSAVRLEGMEDA